MKNVWNNEKLVEILRDGGVVVMPTDTVYGIVGRALDNLAVERIYKIRKRAPEKPCIVLIEGINELKKFSIKLTKEQQSVVENYWFVGPSQDFQTGSTSIILDCQNDSLKYLHRGTKTLAFRIPSSQLLRDLLIKTGPLIAPSANTETMPIAKNINEAKEYFDNLVDLYIDGGQVNNRASRIIKLNNDGSVDVLRS